MNEKEKYDYHVALITVTSTEEAGLQHMYEDWKPLFLEGDDQKYYETSFKRGNKTLKVVTARQSEMGMTAAGVLTMKMISVFRPKYVIMVGIAAGVAYKNEVDQIYARILRDFADICNSLDGRCGYHFPAGVSTFGRQLDWSSKRLASPHGRCAHEVLAANASPTPNTDKEGATAIIRSYCKADLSKLATGAALDIKLLPSSVDGEDGLQAVIALMRGFVSLGGFFMQPDVVDATLLREAQEHPENYGTLSVRVSGWNARFVTLNKEWQDMVIAQNEH